MMVPTIVVWVAGALTPANIAAIVAFLLMFIAPPFIIWIKQINTCRGTEFGTPEGAAAHVLVLALSSPDSETAISNMVMTTDIMQSTEMRGYRISKDIITQARMHSCGSEGQNGIIDTAAVEALDGDGTALVLVDMLKELGLLQYSAAGKCYVTGKLVVDTNTCLKAMCYGVDAYVDAGAITNSWMHLVMSDPVLVKFLLAVICSSCMFGRIGQEATKKTPKMCRAYVEAADRIRPTAQLLIAAIKREDLNPNAIDRNPDPNHPINILGKQLKEEIDSLVPRLLATYDKAELEHDVGTMWVAIQDALREQRDVATPAFLRQLRECQKPVHVAVALRPGSMIPSQPLPAPKVLIVRDVQNKDLELSTSKVLDTVGLKTMALGAAMIGDAFGNVDVLPGHATPLYTLRQTWNAFRNDNDNYNSLFWSRSGTMAALDPITGQILFRTDRLDFGHPSIDAAYIQTHAIDAVTSGAYRDLCQRANADRAALLETAAEEERKRTAHADEVASRLDEAHASGTCPNVVVFLREARDAEAKGRSYTDRLDLEKRLASIGVPCIPLLESEGGFHSKMSISDFDRYLYDVLPANLRVCRGRAVLILPERHVYPATPDEMSYSAGKHLATKCRIFSEGVARAASADVTVLDDLDSPLLDPYRAFVKVDDAFLEKWHVEHPEIGSRTQNQPTVMLNAAAGFRSKADVAREAAKKRKAELDKVVAPKENIGCTSQASRKKVPFDFEDYLKPDGVSFDLARLEALKANFEKQIKAAKDAKDPKKFKFDYWGKSDPSQSNLARALACSKWPSNGRGAVGIMGDYVRVLNKKIKELKASAAG